ARLPAVQAPGAHRRRRHGGWSRGAGARGVEGRPARRRPRPGAAPPAARTLPRAARRKDGPAAGGCLDRGAHALRGGAGDATAGLDGRRRRRSTEPLTYTSRMEEDVEGEVIEDGAELDAETQARRQLALAQVRQYGDPVLRMRAHEVTEFDEDLERLATRMKQLMNDARGVGLAATQVGILQRVFVFQKGEGDVVAVVNPTLTDLSDETEIDDEG